MEHLTVKDGRRRRRRPRSQRVHRQSIMSIMLMTSCHIHQSGCRAEQRKPLVSIYERAANQNALLGVLRLRTNPLMAFDRAICDERSESLAMLFRACFTGVQGILPNVSPRIQPMRGQRCLSSDSYLLYSATLLHLLCEKSTIEI